MQNIISQNVWFYESSQKWNRDEKYLKIKKKKLFNITRYITTVATILVEPRLILNPLK